MSGRVFILIFLLLMAYGVIAKVQNPSGDGKLYGQLADAFLAGQLHLLREPSAELLAAPDARAYAVAHHEYSLNDLTLHDGRFYVMYGPAPALLLFAPYKLLTGKMMDVRFAAWILTSLGTVAACLLLAQLAQRLQLAGRIPAFAYALLAFGTFIPYQLHQATYYQVAIAGAYLFTALGALALLRGEKYAPWASLCFGLAAACRAHFVLSGLLLLAAPGLWRNRWRLWGPFGCCVALLAAYNGARFGDVLNFGLGEQIMFKQHIGGAFFYPQAFVLKLYLYLLHPVPLTSAFPFCDPAVGVMLSPVDFGVAQSPTQEATYGALTNAPFLFMLVFLPGLWRSSEANAARFLKMLGVFALAVLGVLVMADPTMRYLVDFVPWLMILAIVSYLRMRQIVLSPRGQLALRTAAFGLAAYSIAVGVMLGFIGYYGL